MEKYHRQRHLESVLRASRATPSAQQVLAFLAMRSEFHEPTVCVSKGQIYQQTGRHISTVKRALLQLRAEGSIIAIQHAEGGRGHATRYRLCVAGQGAVATHGSAEGQGALVTWPKIYAGLQNQKPTVCQSWLEDCQLTETSRGENTSIKIKPPTKYAATYIEQHLLEWINQDASMFNAICEVC